MLRALRSINQHRSTALPAMMIDRFGRSNRTGVRAPAQLIITRSSFTYQAQHFVTYLARFSLPTPPPHPTNNPTQQVEGCSPAASARRCCGGPQGRRPVRTCLSVGVCGRSISIDHRMPRCMPASAATSREAETPPQWWWCVHRMHATNPPTQPNPLPTTQHTAPAAPTRAARGPIRRMGGGGHDGHFHVSAPHLNAATGMTTLCWVWILWRCYEDGAVVLVGGLGG